MIKERESVIAKISLIIQTGLSAGSFLLASWIFYYPGYLPVMQSMEFLFFLLLMVPVWLLLLTYGGLNKMGRDLRYSYLFFKYLKFIGLGTLILYASSLFLGVEQINGRLLALFAFIDFCFLFGFKLFSFRLMKFFRRRGYNTRQLLIIADGLSVDFIDKLANTSDWGYRIWGIVSSNQEVRKTFGQFNILPSDTDIRPLLDQTIIDEVIYCKGQLDYNEINQLVELCAEVGIVFRLKPSLGFVKVDQSKFTFFNDSPSYVFRNVPGNYLGLKMKALFDYVFSFVVLTLLSPVLLIIAIMIKLEDGGSAFFVQERVGLNGRRFKCYKFRTMVVNAEALKHQLIGKNEQSGPVFKIKLDPRVTRVGEVLRKCSLDELPQFFNVLKGDMSVVGPRPPIPSEVEQYQRWQTRRLSMKPGITCIWQVSGRNNIGFDKWVELDLQYIDQWSLKLDFLIILKTIRGMLVMDGQ
jgi:exopolysaccharide biosynthesis polyprenyl glycosylphosphotransferase